MEKPSSVQWALPSCLPVDFCSINRDENTLHDVWNLAVHKGMSNVSNASSAMALFHGTQAGTDKAITAIDAFYATALDPTEGEFLIQVVGILDDPFANA
ncbi:hypothetical protein [Sulfitobacter sp. 915]|uniref:hypothetical protein n=1 Tax=Sulfitobacter sp. 915 TaxID=3368558 RepID=UPI00374645C7